jgi:hypothetical protein
MILQSEAGKLAVRGAILTQSDRSVSRQDGYPDVATRSKESSASRIQAVEREQDLVDLAPYRHRHQESSDEWDESLKEREGSA